VQEVDGIGAGICPTDYVTFANAGAEQIGGAGEANSRWKNFIFAKTMRGHRSQNVDFRLRQSDFSVTQTQGGALAGHVRCGHQQGTVSLCSAASAQGSPLLAARIRRSEEGRKPISLFVDDDR